MKRLKFVERGGKASVITHKFIYFHENHSCEGKQATVDSDLCGILRLTYFVSLCSDY